ncbi:MAG: hypothetical protein HUU29_10920 [Planctomycetaceae bacterium]|nr:hypothetical protein [Planctomycetaceae bacterium]
MGQAVALVSTDHRVKIVRKIWMWYVRTGGRDVGEYPSKEEAFMAAANILARMRQQ